MWSLALHPMTHSIFKCDWIAQRRRNRKRRRRRWRNENKNQDQNRCTISLSMGAIVLVVTTIEWQRSQYKFIMVCIDPHAQLNASNRRRKFIARKMRSDDNQVNTCQTLKWLSDQFALTNRIRLCFSWTFFYSQHFGKLYTTNTRSIVLLKRTVLRCGWSEWISMGWNLPFDRQNAFDAEHFG